MRKFYAITLSISLLLSSNCIADTVKLKNSANQIILANYLSGSSNTPPIILLHGLLQTNEFSTITSTANNLNELEFSTLSPTLSLGISSRKQSLSCEAIHTHSLDSDTAELKQWIDWLYKKTGKPIILIGHSAGGPVILNYLNKYKDSKVKHTILISLSYYASGPSAFETKQQETQALNAIKAGNNKLSNYSLNYCKTYPTYPKNFLSYYNWNTKKVSQVISKFKKRISIIIGTGDKRIDSNWRKELQKEHKNVTTISGANHFFDQTHEFDLIDALEKILSEHL